MISWDRFYCGVEGIILFSSSDYLLGVLKEAVVKVV